MVKSWIILLMAGMAATCSAQDAQKLVQQAYANFQKLKDYSADVKMDFDIPSVRLKSISGKVYFKQPNRFRIKTNGIVFLPKQHPYYALGFLGDRGGYTAVAGGTEKIGSVNCTVVSVLPLKEGDVILSKFWIDAARGLIMRTQLTTRSNGTIQIEHTYANDARLPTPSRLFFTIDMTKFKIPKAIAVDLNSKSAASTYNQRGEGHITLTITGYRINAQLPDAVFNETYNP
ncbi:MAG: hypothetical protein U0T84_02080 [Chitinophagales bacterium]